MTIRSTLLTTVAFAAVGTTSANDATCGLWKTASTCEDPEGNLRTGGINGTMQLLGTVAGNMYMDFFRYTDENCQTPAYYAHVDGTFNDMGPIDQEHQDQRKFAFNFSLAYIEPLSATGVEAMESLCPCNGTNPNSPSPWAVKKEKVLATCDPDNCDISSVLGGTGIRFDAPAFTIVNNSANGGFSIGLMDIDPTNGFSNPKPYLEYPVSEAICTTETTANLCGSFSTNAFEGAPCEIILNPWTNKIAGSKITNYTFRGPPADVPVLGSYGVYTASIDYFSDTHCGVLEALVREEGSLGYYQRDSTAGLYIVKKNPARFTVQPAASAAGWGTLANLTQNCGCGSATWVVGTPRTITSCPDNTCETPIFTDWNVLGTPSYAYVARNTTSLVGLSADTTAFGSWNTSVTGLTSSGLKTSLEKVPTPINACESGAFTPDLCGTYQSECSSSPTLPLDTTKEITLSGLVFGTGTVNNASAEGKITYTQTIYNVTGAGCQQADQVFIIAGTGYYSQDEFATTPNVNGLYSVDIDFTSFDITPVTQEATDLINNAAMGCPCGGTWQRGVKRTLFTCPATTCTAVWMSTILPGGEFGQAGYGVVQYNVVDKVMRLSVLSASMGKGYAAQFDDETTLLHRKAACPTASNPDPNGGDAAFFSGCWDLPCYRVDSGVNSYAMSGEYDRGYPGVNPDLFMLDRSIFTVGSGCANISAKLVDVSAEGSLAMKGGASGVVGGYVAAVNMSRTTVTPVGSAGADLLNQQCARCGAWTAGVPKHFESTACSCDFLTGLAGFPLQAGTVYSVIKVWDYGGNNQKVDDALRMTTFSTSEAAAVNAQLTRQNGEFARSTSTACPFNPYSPHGASNGGTSGMQGGDVFILLLFISATVYFGGGMLFNYQRTGGYNNGGTPVIPHVTFWRALPGLVSDGFQFAVVERFGTKSGSGSGEYSAFGGPGGGGGSDGTYGAL